MVEVSGRRLANLWHNLAMRWQPLTILSLAALVGCAHIGQEQEPAKSKDDQAIQIGFDPDLLMKPETQRSSAWLGYGLAKADTVQSPKRNHPYAGVDDFDSEYDARLLLTQIWKELSAKKPETDPYLDLLARVQAAGFLPEYVVTVFAKPGWTIPAPVLGKLNFEGFYTWGEANLPKHVVQTPVRVTRKGMPDSPLVPFQALPDPQPFSPMDRPCAKILPALREAVQSAWEETKRLRAAPLAANDRKQFIALLAHAAGRAKDYPRGVVWASPKVHTLAYYAGYCAVDTGDHPGAIAALDTAIRLNPLFFPARSELAQSLVMIKHLDKALAELDIMESLVRGKCDHALVLRKRGFIQFEQGKLKKAYDTYQQSLRFDPASKVAFDEMTLLAHQLLQLETLTPTEKQHYAPPASRQVTTRCTADD